ncbi:MAG: S1C family serine protease [Phycisphaerales bacterium]
MSIARLLLISGGAASLGLGANALQPVCTPPDSPTPLATLVADDAPARPWLGVTVRDTPAALAAQLGVEREATVVIDEVAPGSPAAKVGLERYDLVIGARAGEGAWRPLAEALRAAAPGDRLALRVLRAGEERSLRVTLGERPTGDGGAPDAPARVEIEDGPARAFGIGPDNETARRQAESAMRQAQRAMAQAQRALEEQGLAGALEGLNGMELDFGEFDFESLDAELGFDHEALAREMQAFAERHAQEMAKLESMISARLAPAMAALEQRVEKMMAIIGAEAHKALDAPLAKRLRAALDEADIDATADQIERATRSFIENFGFNMQDGELSLSGDAERIERRLTKALEDAGLGGADLGSVAAWLDAWSSRISDEAASALERLEEEIESHSDSLQDLVPVAPKAPAAPQPETPSLAQPASGGKA